MALRGLVREGAARASDVAKRLTTHRKLLILASL